MRRVPPVLAMRLRSLVRPAALGMGLLAIVLPAVGCRNDAAQRDAYIRELRMQEDQIYELQDYMTEYQHLLRQQRKENHTLREQLGQQTEQSPAADSARPSAEDDTGERSLLDRPLRREDDSPDDAEVPDLPDIDMGEPGLPDIDLGEPVPGGDLEEIPAGELDELSRAASGSRTQLASATLDSEPGVFALPPRPTHTATSCALYAEQTALEPTATSADTRVGLVAIVEPLTADGGAGYFVGEVSLMLVDPLATDDEWEISRWDYTAEEVEHAWRDASRRVLDLKLAAPSDTPLGRPLELWVRLVPQDAEQKILCSTAITLTDPGELASGSQEAPQQVSTGWAAADPLFADEPQAKATPAAWQTATTLPPPAVATAKAVPQPRSSVAERAPDWSPFR